jgi:hypothetical protein
MGIWPRRQVGRGWIRAPAPIALPRRMGVGDGRAGRSAAGVAGQDWRCDCGPIYRSAVSGGSAGQGVVVGTRRIGTEPFSGRWGPYGGPGVPTYWVWGPSGGAFDYPFSDWRASGESGPWQRRPAARPVGLARQDWRVAAGAGRPGGGADRESTHHSRTGNARKCRARRCGSSNPSCPSQAARRPQSAVSSTFSFRTLIGRSGF